MTPISRLMVEYIPKVGDTELPELACMLWQITKREKLECGYCKAKGHRIQRCATLSQLTYMMGRSKEVKAIRGRIAGKMRAAAPSKVRVSQKELLFARR